MKINAWIKIIIALILMGSSMMYSQQIKNWFRPLLSQVHSSTASTPVSSASSQIITSNDYSDFNQAQTQHIQRLRSYYEQVTQQLVQDQLPRLSQQVLDKMTQSTVNFPTQLDRWIKKIHKSLEKVTRSQDLKQARKQYAVLSQNWYVLMEIHPPLNQGLYSFYCPMVKGFQKWFQKDTAIKNPYMGPSMLQCGGTSNWESGVALGIEYWTCAMHPSVKVKDAIPCPLCHMDLIAVTKDSLQSGEIMIDPLRTQKLGIISTNIQKRPFHRVINVLGTLGYQKNKVYNLNIRTQAWVEELYPWEIGDRVKKGKILLRYYSPQLVAHQHELLNHGKHKSLRKSVEQRLLSLGMSSYLIQTIRKQKKVIQRLPLVAPISGVIIDHHTQQKSYVQAGQSLIKIADDRTLWVDIEVFERDIPSIQLKNKVVIKTIDQKLKITATIDSITPHINPNTQSKRVRVLLDNQDGKWQAGMNVDVQIKTQSKMHLQIPYEAWLPTGDYDIVFQDLGEGRFKPVPIKIIDMNQEWIAIESEQLQEGDRILKSGTFLLASESRIKSALPYWQSNPQHK